MKGNTLKKLKEGDTRKNIREEDVLNILKEKGIPLNKLKKGGIAKHTQGCGHNLNKRKE